MDGADHSDWRHSCREAYERNPHQYSEPDDVLGNEAERRGVADANMLDLTIPDWI